MIARRSATHLAIFVAMVLFLPWPLYLIAVLSLVSLALTLGMIVAGLFKALLAPAQLLALVPLGIFVGLQLALGLFVFDRCARRLAGVVAGSAHRRWSLAFILAAIFLVSFLPVFGGGENILGGGLRTHDLYTEYAQSLGIATARPPPGIAEEPAPPQPTVIERSVVAPR